MKRISALAVSQYCGKASSLDVGAGRAAHISTAFHALCAHKYGRAGADKVKQKLDALTDAEREDLKTWYVPTTLDVMGFRLEYRAALTEFPVALSGDGKFIEGEYPPEALIAGTADMFWSVSCIQRGEQYGPPPRFHVKHGGLPALRFIVVADIKKSQFTTPDGPETLQLAGYGYALCKKYDADGFLPALWIAETGEWLVGEPRRIGGFSGAAIWGKLRHAATNNSDSFATGPHCSGCYSRLRCPAHLVQMDDTYAVPGTTEQQLDREGVKQLLVHEKRLSDTAKAMRDYAREWVRRHGDVTDGNGKAWGPVQCKGKESTLKPSDLRARMGAAAEHYIVQGAPYEQYRWRKA